MICLLYQNTNYMRAETLSLLFSAVSLAVEQVLKKHFLTKWMNEWMNASYFECEYKDIHIVLFPELQAPKKWYISLQHFVN